MATLKSERIWKFYKKMSDSSDSGFDRYRRTCSLIFGKATASQLRYLNAAVELQQTLLTSCDGTVANQIRWFEKFAEKNKMINLNVDTFLKNYTSLVDLIMNLVSVSYDFTTINMQSLRRSFEFMNQYYFNIKKDQGEIYGIPISES
jgi:benzoyl-CoA reductase/2-hydroxyglutaryl-CoA dehydratase subunit BcrC/BadD/HgdB